ncbi:MAG: MarR family transcriptional regulator [Alphaproteobacteria bacterium]|nr:MarR family transcriptional regulator [Alphaproteobacteria bacterium]
MTKHKIESFHALMGEMRAVAKGEKTAPKAAGKVSFNSAEAVVRLLTAENRQLLAIIRDKAPQSIQELSELSGRAQPNLTRTLSKLEAMGLVKAKAKGKRKILTVQVKKIVFEIDPCSDRDTLRLAS